MKSILEFREGEDDGYIYVLALPEEKVKVLPVGDWGLPNKYKDWNRYILEHPES